MTQSMRPKLLDLFCGAGGAAMGYHRAGFDVVGVDINPQPHYPFEFHQGDAMTWPLDGFDAIHASPPCQAFTALKTMYNAKPHLDLLTPTRARLMEWGGPSVIENVEGAPMADYVRLCGTSFGLGTGEAELRRHRWFEVRPEPPFPVPQCIHGGRFLVIGVYGGHGRDRRRIRPATVGVYGDGNGRDYRKRPATVGVYGGAGGASVRDGTQQFSTAERAEAMGIDWMTGSELSQAIPPAYTEWIGAQLLQQLPATPREPSDLAPHENSGSRNSSALAGLPVAEPPPGSFPVAATPATAGHKSLPDANPGAVSSPRGGSGDLPLQPGFGS